MTNRVLPGEIVSQVKEIVRDALRVKSEAVTGEARLFLDLQAESLDIVDIKFRLEEAFGLRIPDDAIVQHLGENLSHREIGEKLTVATLVDYITRRFATQGEGQ